MTVPHTAAPAAIGTLSHDAGIVLDVRTTMEHNEKRLVAPHAHIPLDELKPDDFMMRHGLDKDSAVYIVCRSGKRAAQAADKFIASGYHNIHIVDGGLIACEDQGLAVHGHAASSSPPQTTAQKAPLTLERQVRITAGLIAAAGAALALTLNSLFALIPLFVGCGLVFAGVTDRCGMALILTKAPWNRGVQSGARSCSAPAASAKTGQSCQ
jgi:rhodanese-related sulfurtransferase